MKCFSFEKLIFKTGIFDESIDCTYIIHLESDLVRLKNIKIQLNKFKTTKKTFIYNNKGFKNCKKNLYKQKTNYDIIDSYLQIFKHANQNNYYNILIFEDDFILNRLFLKEDINSINDFCLNYKHKNFILNLGMIPFLLYPINSNFYKILLGFSTHNSIYSKSIRKHILDNINSINKKGDWDWYLNSLNCRYIYKKSLIYQKFEDTDNRKNWPLGQYGIKDLGIYYLNLLDFEHNYKKAFQITYNLVFAINLFLFILFLFILYKIIYLVNKS